MSRRLKVKILQFLNEALGETLSGLSSEQTVQLMKIIWESSDDDLVSDLVPWHVIPQSALEAPVPDLDLYNRGEEEGYIVPVAYYDGDIGKLNPRTGVIIWSDGMSENLSKYWNLISDYIALYKSKTTKKIENKDE
tara:strand:+ start:3494 stop:3901 length:408 start_codon:yes stop_codon:yes gene_type:complete